MSTKFFRVQNGLLAGNLTIDSATGAINTTGNINTTANIIVGSTILNNSGVFNTANAQITGGNIDSTVIGGTTPVAGHFTNIAGTLTTAAQPNVTSVGTLTGLTVTAPISGNVTGSAATVTAAAQPAITSVGTLTGLTVSTTITGSVTGNAGTANKLATAHSIAASGDATWSASFDGSADTSAALTLATVNSSPVSASFQKLTVNGKGLVTATTSVGSSDITTALGYTPVNKTGDSMSGNLAMGSNYITGLANPVSAQDAATKNYVDTTVAGLSWKSSVVAATTASITLSGTQSIDGVGVTVGQRVLVKNQSTTSQNGIYVVASGSWTRATDSATAAELNGEAVNVTGGSSQANTQWLQTATVVTVDTSPVTYVQFAGFGAYSAGTGLTLSANQFSITNVGSAGTYTAVTTNAQGQVTAGTNLAVTGDVSGTASSGNLSLTLATVNSSVGTYGDSTHVSQFTVNGKGLITAAANVALPSATLNSDASATVTLGSTTALTLATVNSNTGTWGSVTQIPQFVVNGKGLVTAVSNISLPVIVSSISAGSGISIGGTSTAPSVTSTDTLDNVVGRGATTSTAVTLSGGVTVPSITHSGTNGVGDIGQSGSTFATVYATTFSGVSTTAKYADLAEKYVADKAYAPGTVVEFGGAQEVTMAGQLSRKVAGVVSTAPAYLMNSALTGPTVVAVAFVGRVPCFVKGTVNKGDMMVSDGYGHAIASKDPASGSVIGKALQNYSGVGIGVIEVVVGK